MVLKERILILMVHGNMPGINLTVNAMDHDWVRCMCWVPKIVHCNS